jgi:hypothetical protein
MEELIVQSCALPGKAPGCAIGAFIGLHGQPKAPMNSGYGLN